MGGTALWAGGDLSGDRLRLCLEVAAGFGWDGELRGVLEREVKEPIVSQLVIEHLHAPVGFLTGFEEKFRNNRGIRAKNPTVDRGKSKLLQNRTDVRSCGARSEVRPLDGERASAALDGDSTVHVFGLGGTTDVDTEVASRWLSGVACAVQGLEEPVAGQLFGDFLTDYDWRLGTVCGSGQLGGPGGLGVSSV